MSFISSNSVSPCGIWSDRCVPLIFDVEECAVYHRAFLASGCFEEPRIKKKCLFDQKQIFVQKVR